jgi:TonB family protein
MWRAITLVIVVTVLLPCFAQAQAFLGLGQQTSAVDAKGVRHSASTGQAAPWLDDRVKAVAPEYPYADRARHHTGAGRFRLELDLKIGAVNKITVTKSTGFQTLDNCVIAAFRRWRWKPGRWKEIDVPVDFRLGRPPRRLPPGSVRLPQA